MLYYRYVAKHFGTKTAIPGTYGDREGAELEDSGKLRQIPETLPRIWSDQES